jgi:hypothetical protein
MLNIIMDINIKRIHAIVERDNLTVIANFRLYHSLTIWAIETILMVLHLFTHAARSLPWLSVGDSGAFANARVIPAISRA